MKYRYFAFTIFLVLLNSCVFAENGGKRLTSVEKEAGTGGVVYYNMSRQDLCRIYMQFPDKKQSKDGNREWITFSGCPTEDPTDTITFCLEDGRVKDWYKGRRRP